MQSTYFHRHRQAQLCFFLGPPWTEHESFAHHRCTMRIARLACDEEAVMSGCAALVPYLRQPDASIITTTTAAQEATPRFAPPPGAEVLPRGSVAGLISKAGLNQSPRSVRFPCSVNSTGSSSMTPLVSPSPKPRADCRRHRKDVIGAIALGPQSEKGTKKQQRAVTDNVSFCSSVGVQRWQKSSCNNWDPSMSRRARESHHKHTAKFLRLFTRASILM